MQILGGSRLDQHSQVAFARCDQSPAISSVRNLAPERCGVVCQKLEQIESILLGLKAFELQRKLDFYWLHLCSRAITNQLYILKVFQIFIQNFISLIKQSTLIANTNHEYDYLFKVLLIGNSGVGISSLLLRFADDVFSDNFMPTIGVVSKIRTIEVDGKTIKLQIWGTAGHVRFKAITSSCYKDAHGIIVTYDITDRERFSANADWMNEVEKHASDNISRILVGYKSDMVDARQMSTDEGKELAKHCLVRFLETSAKGCKNVEEALIVMTREIKPRVAIAKPNKPTAGRAASSTKFAQGQGQDSIVYDEKRLNNDHGGLYIKIYDNQADQTSLLAFYPPQLYQICRELDSHFQACCISSLYYLLLVFCLCSYEEYFIQIHIFGAKPRKCLVPDVLQLLMGFSQVQGPLLCLEHWIPILNKMRNYLDGVHSDFSSHREGRDGVCGCLTPSLTGRTWCSLQDEGLKVFRNHHIDRICCRLQSCTQPLKHGQYQLENIDLEELHLVAGGYDEFEIY